MEDIGFNGTGSRFSTRYGSGSEILGKQLNDSITGIQSGLPMPNIGLGPSVSFTAGGAVITGDNDPNIFGRYQYNADPPQFKCVVYVDPSGGEDNLKYYLKIARGVVTATKTRFPFTQGPTGTGLPALIQDGWVMPCQERMIFDVALFPTASRTPGPLAESTSPWMASNGKFELKPDVEHYYVTVSFLDYDDALNWYPENTFIKNHQPWISIVPSTGVSKEKIFTLNTPTILLSYVSLGRPGDDDRRGQWGDFPNKLGYGMHVIARIDWKEDQQMWEVRQEMLGPISMNIPLCTTQVAYEINWEGVQEAEAYYATAVGNKFSIQMTNYDYIAKFSNAGFTGSAILNEEWWYDPKDI